MGPGRWALCAGALLLASVGFAQDDNPGGDPWYLAHTYPGDDGCLAVQAGQHLAAGETLLVFDKGQPVRAGRVRYIFSSESAKRTFDERGFQKVYGDKALWDSIGCYRGFNAADPRDLARLEMVGRGEESVFPIAIQGLPAPTLTVGGRYAPVPVVEMMELSRRLASSVPSEFRRPDVLRSGRRYGQRGGNQLTEVFLGRAFYAKPGAAASIDSIEIYRAILDGDRILRTFRFWRWTGVEERAESEAPELGPGNWSNIQDEIIGFFSVDQGKTWNQVEVDLGFEGINWHIIPLTQNAPPLWDYFLYQLH